MKKNAYLVHIVYLLAELCKNFDETCFIDISIVHLGTENITETDIVANIKTLKATRAVFKTPFQ